MIKSSTSEMFQLKVSRRLFEMDNLFIIWLYVFKFDTFKIVSFCILCYFCCIESAIY